MKNNSGKTAITRKTFSQPVKYLLKNDRLNGRALDYGCGKGFDADELGIEGYDLNHRPKMPPGKFDTIVCNYVLNVIESEHDRRAVIQDIENRLSENGVAFVSVRNDVKSLNGKTKIGTWQGKIDLDFPVEKRTANFVMFRIEKKQPGFLF